MSEARLVVVMGVAGCGKSTVAEAAAIRFNGTYLDADSFHTPSNIAKMSKGVPLNDDDRFPWLQLFGQSIAAREGVVFGACSALKRSYREAILEATDEPVLFVWLEGSRALIAQRMKERSGHFMPTELLDSQFDALEPPAADENAVEINIDCSVSDIVEKFIDAVRQK